MRPENKGVLYFPSLNGVRFLAAAMVILFHCMEQFGIEFAPSAGGTGVTVFFVLSGFLITYLLLKEKELAGDIDIKSFYVRRILRIWPLYFLVIIVSLVSAFFSGTSLQDFFVIKLVLYALFLSNAAIILFAARGFPSQLWSVSTEEQFYLIWPWVIKKSNGRKLWVILLCIPVVFMLARFGASYMEAHYKLSVGGVDVWTFLNRFLFLFRIDCMAIGAIAAYITYHGNFKKWLGTLYSPVSQLGAVLLFLLLLLAGYSHYVFEHLVYAILAAVIILNLATNKKTLFHLERPFFDFMGKISYGLYVFHPLVIFWMRSLLRVDTSGGGIGYWALFTVGCFCITTIIASVSYRYFEKPILAYKTRFAHIVSGDAVSDKKGIILDDIQKKSA